MMFKPSKANALRGILIAISTSLFIIFNYNPGLSEENPTPTPPTAPTTTTSKVTVSDEIITAAKTTAEGAESLVKDAGKLVSHAESLSKKIADETKKLTGPIKASLADLEGILSIVSECSSDDLWEKLPDWHGKKLPGTKSELEDYITQLPADSDNEEVKKARKACETAKENIETKIKAIQPANKKITDAIIENFKAFANSLKTHPGKIIASVSGVGKKDLLAQLPGQLLSLEKTTGLRNQLVGIFGKLQTNFKFVYGDHYDGVTLEVKTVLNNLNLEYQPIPVEATGWLNSLSTFVGEEVEKTLNLLKEIADAKTINLAKSAEALARVNKSNDIITAIKKLNASWLSLSVKLKPILTDGTALNGPSAVINDLMQKAAQMEVAVSLLEDTLAGDMSGFVTDQMRLYYCTDVRRLVEILNPAAKEIGGVEAYRKQAQEERKKLLEAEIDLADALMDVNNIQRRILELEGELKAARNDLKLKQREVDRTDGEVSKWKEKNEEAEAFVEKVQGKLNDGDATQEDLENAKERQAEIEASYKQAQEEYNNAVKDRDTVKERVGDLEDENSSLPAQIQKAKGALEATRQSVKQYRKISILSAQAEAEAFALARDNPPYIHAIPMMASTNAAKRVFIYGFDDRKIIYLRGLRADIEIVKEIIAEFDKPAPQARLTLWTLELNGQACPDKIKFFNSALEKVEENLSKTRWKIAASLSILRDCITEKVNEVASENLSLLKWRKWSKLNSDDDPDLYLFARFHFYDEEVLERLGFIPDAGDWREYKFTRWTIPDPVAITTLGEGLLVLSLAKQEYRQFVLKSFAARIKLYFDENDLDLNITDGTIFPRLQRALGCQLPPVHKISTNHQVEKTNISLKSPIKTFDIPLKKSQLSSTQHEILYALQRAAIKEILPGILHLSDEYLDKLDKLSNINDDFIDSVYNLDALFNKYENEYDDNFFDYFYGLPFDIPAAKAPEYFSDEIEAFNLEDKQKLENDVVEYYSAIHKLFNLKDKLLPVITAQSRLKFIILPIISWLNKITGLVIEIPTEYLELQSEWINILKKPDFDVDEAFQIINEYESSRFPEVEKKAVVEGFKRGLNSVERLYPRSKVNARIAAADQMLKELIIAVEDDLDYHFIQPMLKNLREELMGSGVNVGVLQRTSVLASNRLVARVDPMTSAQLPLGREQDILQATTQFVQLISTAQTGGLMGALSALEALEREGPPEIYGITSGALFQVTPIFDPSGQALRFKFDYVYSTKIREPDNSLNPQLPRVERYTINTEVQLSNLELREISRFESNVKLGIPSQEYGGIPILKDINYIGDLPLFGWFERRVGEAAVMQETILFAQTAMYPTIGDLMELLTAPFPYGEDIEKEEQE